MSRFWFFFVFVSSSNYSACKIVSLYDAFKPKFGEKDRSVLSVADLRSARCLGRPLCFICPFCAAQNTFTASNNTHGKQTMPSGQV